MSNINKLKKRPKWVSLNFEEEPYKIAYNRGAFTPRYAREIQERSQQAEPDAEYVVLMLEDLLLDWDLTSGDKTKVKINRATIEDLPRDFLWAIMGAINEDVLPPPEPKSDSGSSFSAGEDAESAPSGT